MRRFVLAMMLVLAFGAVHAQRAKYVFLFIGDGMGVNHVNATEVYLAQKDGKDGIVNMLFPSFPVASVATTYSASNPVTDSAAAGTAIATSTKTKNGAIGVDKDMSPVQSVAAKAKKAGMKVGIATSVSVDNATPAAFFAHQPNRYMGYEIAAEIPASGFDFFAGSGFSKPTKDSKGKDMPDIHGVIEESGYAVAYGLDDYKAKKDAAGKMVLIQKKGSDNGGLVSAIDRKPGDLTLTEITESAVEFLTKDKKSKGFFLMVEGGKIDWAGHGNDAASMVHEVIDMDNAIEVAYEFYKKHPKETLIVVTADHETGGLALATNGYLLYLNHLDQQKQSIDVLSRKITDLRKGNNKVSWEEVKTLLTQTMGFFDSVPLSWEQERALHDAYHESFVRNQVKFEETLYARTEPLAVAAKKVMSEAAHIAWGTTGHSAGYVPVYAVGAGADEFKAKMDNTDISKKIVKIAGYTK